MCSLSGVKSVAKVLVLMCEFLVTYPRPRSYFVLSGNGIHSLQQKSDYTKGIPYGSLVPVAYLFTIYFYQ